VIWVHELETGIEREASDSEKEAFKPDLKSLEREFKNRAGASAELCHVASAKRSPHDPSVAMLCSPEETELSPTMRWKFYVLRGDGRSPLALAAESNRVSDYWWSDDGKFLYYIATEGDGHAPRMLVEDERSGQSREFFDTREVLREFSMNAAGGLIACTRETNTSPAKIALIDQKGHALRTLADLNPEFRYLEIQPAERISGINRFGEEWFGHLVRPSGYDTGKRYPLIVTLYRSGDYFLLGASGNENPIQVYAAHGFAVLSFDIGHFHFRKPGDFADNLLEWASPTASLLMAVERLIDEGIVDPARVGISGFSHGAEILEFAISHTHVFHAAVESGPAARDPYFYYMAGSNWHEVFLKWGLGGWPDGAARSKWKELSASLNADRIEAPLLVNSADSEYLASLALCASLEQLEKPVELFIYPNELHAKNQPKHRYEIYERNLDWFQFWLRDFEDPDPNKAEQYARWRRLKKV
jgi:dipeptidyl aminopeptidase/acylaminoacyl peptidase